MVTIIEQAFIKSWSLTVLEDLDKGEWTFETISPGYNKTTTVFNTEDEARDTFDLAFDTLDGDDDDSY